MQAKAKAKAPEPEPEEGVPDAKYNAFEGQGYSLSGRTAPKKGTEEKTYAGPVRPIDLCKGGLAVPPPPSRFILHFSGLNFLGFSYENRIVLGFLLE